MESTFLTSIVWRDLRCFTLASVLLADRVAKFNICSINIQCQTTDQRVVDEWWTDLRESVEQWCNFTVIMQCEFIKWKITPTLQSTQLWLSQCRWQDVDVKTMPRQTIDCYDRWSSSWCRTVHWSRRWSESLPSTTSTDGDGTGTQWCRHHVQLITKVILSIKKITLVLSWTGVVNDESESEQ